LCQEKEVPRELDGASSATSENENDIIYPERLSEDRLIPPLAAHPVIHTSASFSDEDAYASSDDEDTDYIRLSHMFMDMRVEPDVPYFFGKSALLDMEIYPMMPRFSSDSVGGTRIRSLDTPSPSVIRGTGARRAQFWQTPPVR
jgi:hypothetical protein